MKKLNDNIKSEHWKIGFDPEYFLQDLKTGKIESAIPILKNDKNSPIKLGKGLLAYADNCLLEHTVPVSSSKEEMLVNIKNAFTKIQKNVLGNKYKLVSKAAHKFDIEQLKDKKSFEIGCSSSFNVWDECVTPRQEFADTTRTSAGHIHISHPKLADFKIKELAIKLLDVIVGNSLVVLNQDETAPIRRNLYGKSGEFRMEGTRIEFRVPDSFYLRSPQTTELAYDLIEYTMDKVFNGGAEEILSSIDVKEQRESINLCKKDLAMNTLVNKVKLTDELLKRVTANYGEMDLYKNWGIKI